MWTNFGIRARAHKVVTVLVRCAMCEVERQVDEDVKVGNCGSNPG
jgi:hypothetical protein